MISIRLGVFTAIAGVCLWGLFSLLDSLNEPALLRSTKAVVVKGCDALESAEALAQCPALLCEKAVLDAKLAPLRAQFEIRRSEPTTDKGWIVVGRATMPGQSAAPVAFTCEGAGNKVSGARAIDTREFDGLTQPQP